MFQPNRPSSGQLFNSCQAASCKTSNRSMIFNDMLKGNIKDVISLLCYVHYTQFLFQGN